MTTDVTLSVSGMPCEPYRLNEDEKLHFTVQRLELQSYNLIMEMHLEILSPSGKVI